MPWTFIRGSLLLVLNRSQGDLKLCQKVHGRPGGEDSWMTI